MIRSLFTVASALSLLLGAGAAILMVRGFLQPEMFSFWWDPHLLPKPKSTHGEVYSNVTLHRSFEIQSNSSGILWLGTGIADGWIKPGRVTVAHHLWDAPGASQWPIVSFRMEPPVGLIPGFWRWEVRLSLPFVLLVSAVLPVLWICRRHASHRSPKGDCSNCGYGLRASESRCPECGTPIARSAGAKA